MNTRSQPPLWQHLLDESLQQARKTAEVLRDHDSVNHGVQSTQAFASSLPRDVFDETAISPIADSAGTVSGPSGFRRFSTVFTPSEMPLLPGHEMVDSFHSPMNDPALDEFAVDPSYLASQQELRSLMFNTAQSAAPSRAASPAPITPSHSPQWRDTSTMSGVVNSKKRVLYLKNYIDVVARWLDMFDENRTFGVQLVSLARHSRPLLYAILGISARHMERKARISASFDSLELYQDAIRSLSPLLQSRDPLVVATCVILCCLEMMSASAQDWRKHLEGCAALFRAFEINGLSGGTDQAVFWCYARMDLCGALISDGTEGTLLNIESWIPPGTPDHSIRAMFRATGSADMHANYAVYLCARTCHLLAQRTKYIELGKENGYDDHHYSQEWEWLWNEVEAWFSDRPASMLPLEVVEGQPFPRILFSHWCAISSNQLTHTASMLLLNNKPATILLEQGPESSLLWHARRICGISATNQHEGCLNNALQPLWIAGLRFADRREHESLVRLIRSIELLTGWGFSWRIFDLEEAWGYRVEEG